MILISSSDDGAKCADALRDLLAEIIDVTQDKIVRSHAGRNQTADGSLSDRMRCELLSCRAVLAIVMPGCGSDTAFELGAAWVMSKRVFLILAGGADFRDIPAVIRDAPFADMDDKNAPVQLMSICREVASCMRAARRKNARTMPLLEKTVSLMRARASGTGDEYGDEREGDEIFSTNGTWRNSEAIDVVCMADSSMRKEFITVRVSWDNILKTIAPHIRTPKPEDFIEDLIIELCKYEDLNMLNGINYQLLKFPSITSECMTIITSYLSSKNYIMAMRAPQSALNVKSRGIFWKLTEKGEERLRDIMFERRKLNPVKKRAY
ncbi:hypothetical protein FACS1894216_07520 [Synergistales bacterium]|nr:hypothetical protein FACS1894216_07520 [Synergistales bacterium]